MRYLVSLRLSKTFDQFFNSINKNILVQSPSKILKSDYRLWDVSPSAAIAEIYRDEDVKSGLFPNKLYEVLEFVIYGNSQSFVSLRSNQKLLVLPLFGKARINSFDKIIETGEVVVLESVVEQDIFISNALSDLETDVLVIVFDKLVSENSYRVNTIDLEIRNKLNFIDEGFNFPGFIGVFDGREEGRYILKRSSNKIFTMVINGAFEFQNRLMETRDAILIWDLEELEFEALSEDALILFFEFPD